MDEMLIQYRPTRSTNANTRKIDYINRLPNECLILIFSYLKVAYLLCDVARVSRRWALLVGKEVHQRPLSLLIVPAYFESHLSLTNDMLDFYEIYHTKQKNGEWCFSISEQNVNAQMLVFDFEKPNFYDKLVKNFANVQRLAIVCAGPEDNLTAIQLAYLLLHWSHLKRYGLLFSQVMSQN